VDGADAYNDSIIDENRVINVSNCQYYIDVAQPNNPENGYQSVDGYGQFYLPKGITIFEKGAQSDLSNTDTTISYKYRGKRYGFAQKAKYIPLLERYCQEYTKDGKKYYGYLDTKYDSPVFL
jgi:hypothetical protein